MANNTQTTINTAAPQTYVNKTYYDKKLLEKAKTLFVYANFGQKRGIPRNGGKTVEFRRFNLFTPNTITQQLTEGVTPNGQALSQSKIEATIAQYGAFVEVSDLLDLTAYDPVIGEASELLGEQMGTVLDWVTRDAMLADASVQFAGGKTAMTSLTSTEKFSVDEVKKAVRTLKKAKARPFGNGRAPHFICIVDPDVVYDLMKDTEWLNVRTYQDSEAIYNGELGKMYGVVFVESTEGKVSRQSVLNKVNANTTSSTDFVLKNDPTDAEAEYLSVGGNKIKIGTTEYTLASTGSYTPATKTVKLSTAASLSADDIVYSEDAGAPDASTKAAPDVHHSLIFGSDAYGTIDIAGSGTMHTIIKPVGSGGTADPLDQRSTIGCKVDAYTAKVLNSNWIIDIMSTVSA